MEDQAWSPVLSTASGSYRSKLKSHFETCVDFEEVDGDGELKTAYPCLFCGEDFDLLELCCHIEEDHSVEAKTGICPLCVTWVGTNLVEHISAQHGNILKSQFKSGYPKFEPYGALSLSSKDLMDGDGCWQSFSIGSSCEISTSKTACDQLLSFLYCSSALDERENLQPASSKESIEEVDSGESVPARDVQQSFTDEDQIGKAQRSAFVQELFVSTILDSDF
ncbi:protein DEHYDRATION-INDUCED 19 homolog 3-like [Prosopis cineraria]|uniref:protein DEHYDRATION-INDUCED 19 homolog 3-like n=1 Tax=Prosopis cineraria TaxID=364024 RepID=UPI00240F28C4|nr:protein DEHYDRATION-INDUCED 19 homolog 3-like [Prosopis cineraria]